MGGVGGGENALKVNVIFFSPPPNNTSSFTVREQDGL